MSKQIAREKQITKTEETAIITRTPLVIAAEIRSIDTQTRDFVLRSAVEIGKRLNEVKSLVPHGSWGNWLQENVSYGQSTANNFMRIASEYQDPHSQALANLSYTQAIALLSLPADERAEFVAENDAENLSSRELQAAIKEKQELQRQLEEEQERVRTEQQALELEKGQRVALYNQYQLELELRQKVEAELSDAQAAAAKTGNEKDDAKSKVELRKAEKALSESQQRVATLEAEIELKVKAREQELNAELDEKLRQREQELSDQAQQREDTSSKQLAEMQALLEKNNNTAAIKVKVCFDNLVENFKSLLAAVGEVQNEEEKQKLQGAIVKLCDKMKDSL